jgi:hypothetical protein
MAETPPPIGEVPENYFTGGRHIISGELPAHLNLIGNATRVTHTPVITPDSSTPQPGQGPTPVIIGTWAALQYDQAIDKSYRLYKIPGAYVGPAVFHIHWTKSADGDEGGNSVRWRISYTLATGFPGLAEDIVLPTPTVVTVDDTYDDASTDSSRFMHTTADTPLPGFERFKYVGICVDYDSGNTTLATSDPVLVSLDLLLTESINK